MSILEISEEASLKVLSVRSEESDAEKLGLRVAVSGVSGVEYSYDLAFVPVEEASDDDISYEVGELTIIIPSASKEKLAGATLDIPQNADQGGLVIRNPNRPNPLGDLGELELTGEVPDRINQLLEQKVNPALASHGGFATLVGVDGSTAHVSMGGGCQGCAMSAATLTEGIRASMLEAIPEIKDVVDVTDHSSGEQPFYS